MKKTIILPLLFISSLINAEIFNLGEEIHTASKITNTLEQIATYQNIAKNIALTDSTRLAKKFIRMIKALHTICYAHDDNTIKNSFKNLLSIAITNKKLQTVDYAKDLPKLIRLYALAKPKESLPKPTTHSEKPKENNVEQAKPSEITIKKQKLKESVAQFDRNNVIHPLQIKDLLRQVKKIKAEVNEIQEHVSNLSTQAPSISKLYSKLLQIEQLLQINEYIPAMKGIGIDQNIEDELSPLLQKLLDKEFE